MQARRRSRAAAPPTIDGEAVIIGRVIGAPPPPKAPINDNRPPEAEAFVRGESRPFRPDLVFPGTVRWPGAAVERRGFAGGLRGFVATGCLAVAAALAAMGLAGSRGEHPAPASPAPDFALTEVRRSVVPHGSGAVLEVEGRIRNLSHEARSVPALVVGAPGERGFSRTVRPSARPLAPGRSLFFHSTLAVPSATNAGTVGVTLAGAGWRRP